MVQGCWTHPNEHIEPLSASSGSKSTRVSLTGAFHLEHKMNSYMKELKSKIPSIVTQRGLKVDHVQVKGSILIIHLASESQVVKASLS